MKRKITLFMAVTKETAQMKRISLVLGAIALGLLAAAPTQAAVPKLVGTVGPGFTITLTKGGANVTKLKAGQYSITVNDRASIHDFHLTGPGVNKATSVPGTGKTTWTVTLQKGKTYRFMCDPHASIMKGSFKTF
jgi:plastocyanin